MLLPRFVRCSQQALDFSKHSFISWKKSYSTALKSSEPLRILFCGSDEFSCASLDALHQEHGRNPELIQSIDVVVRPSKPTGRGHKILREIPLRTLAEKLDLPIHERDTFTGWEIPKPESSPINLIIAVSFGLFVPPRLIHAVKYGGLNVHPSILPDLRGPAPIHHALLRGDSHTGITIQTLSTEAFDHGIPLLQTPPTNLFPISPDHTPTQLQADLALEGARMLVQTLREGLHVPPHQSCQDGDGHHHVVASPLQHAPKITPQDRQILWTANNLTAEDIVRRARVLGPLWTHLIVHEKGEERVKRAILEELTVVTGTPRQPKLKPIPNAGSWKNGKWVPNKTGVETMAYVGKRSAEDGELTWVQKTPMPQTKEERKGEANPEWDTENVRMEYWVGKKRGDEGVTVRVSRQSWLRIGKIKVEGSTAKPAKVVLEAKT